MARVTVIITWLREGGLTFSALLILVITFNFRVLPAAFGGAQKCVFFPFFRQVGVASVEYFLCWPEMVPIWNGF